MTHTKKSLFTSIIALVICCSMLMSSTFAWFTSSVTSSGNVVAAGNLKVELKHENAYIKKHAMSPVEVTEDADKTKLENKLFVDANGNDMLWEPGAVTWENFTIRNASDLALVYQFAISATNENFVVNADGTVTNYGLSQVLKVGLVPGGLTDDQIDTRGEVIAAVAADNWKTVKNFVHEDRKALLAVDDADTADVDETERKVGVVVYWEPSGNDNNYNLNNGKTVTTSSAVGLNDALRIDLGIKVIATQAAYESDSFGNNYDAQAADDVFPKLLVSENVKATVEVDANNLVTTEVEIVGAQVKATVPAGVKVTGTELTMTVTELEATNENITIGDNEEGRSLDVHIEGVANDNTVPIIIDLGEVMPKGLNIGNYKLYHVENNQPAEMKRKNSINELVQHNDFYYNTNGTLVLALKSFSEVAAVANIVNAWNGSIAENFDGGAGTEDDPYIIANADQLAYFGQVVGGMKDQEPKTFAGEFVKLVSDIDLGDDEDHNDANKIFYPIGYYNSTGSYEKVPNGGVTSKVNAFKGTFDGNGHTISNFYQNTWEMFGDYNDGYSGKPNHYKDAMGLFGYVHGGTVKNLTVDHFSSDGEFTPTGVIAAYAVNSTFENIAITNCNPRVYNTGNGGIVGIGGNSDDPDTYNLTFNNITIDNTNKITALWGSWDVACGGLVGMFRGAGHVYMTNCHVAAQMDVYNDVCGNYQYYWYRYSGMMVGTNKNMVEEDGYTVPETSKFHAKDCTVHFGDWNDYYYCELVANSLASYTHDHQFSRLTEIASLDEIKSGDTWTKAGNFLLISGDTKTCYHIVNKNGVLTQHLHTDAGEETVSGKTVLKEDKQIVYLPFNQLFTGYGWGVKHIPVYNGEDYAFEGITILDRSEQKAENKFVSTGVLSFSNNTKVSIGSIFSAVDKYANDIKDENVSVTVSPVIDNGLSSGVSAEYVPNSKSWEDGTLTFSGTGAATVTITDYYFCTPTQITVTITEKTAVEKFETKFTGDFLYRVGNQNTVSLGSLFAAKDGATIGTVDVTVETVNGTGASGTYTSNATWANGTIQFSGTGVVKVTITDNDYCTPTVLYLEVVDAKNITSASGSKDIDVVLLNNVTIATDGAVHYTNCTVYGNGFTFDVRGGMNQYNSKQGHGIIIINNATLDHLRIVGDVYDEYGMYTTTLAGAAQNDYTAAVDATNSIIQNCYIANCATPIRSNGNTIVDTTLYGGTVANLLISGGTNTLTNVTTVNYNDERDVIGMGIVITDGASADSTKLILNGYLKQHNYVYETDISEITVEEAKTVFNSMFADQFSAYHIGSNPKAVNTGIISINEEIDLNDEVFVDNANTGYTISNDVTIAVSAYGINKSVNAAVASVPASGNSVNNGSGDNGNQQGDYLPTFTFNLGDQMLAKDNDDDTRYLIGDKNGLTAMYPKGEGALSLDLTKLATVTKYTNVSYPVSAKCIDPDGQEQTGTVPLDAKGTYKLVFTVEDNVFYDQNGNKIEKSVVRTYEVPLVLDIYEKAIADATMDINSTNLTGEWDGYSGNWKYTMYPLDAINEIMDDADKDGELEDFNYKASIASVVLSPASNNAFSAATTVTITYDGGQVLELVLGVPIDCSSPGASNGGKTLSASTDDTHGIKIVSDGKIANKCDGTWPITSWSFKGTSQKTIADNTQVTITFSAESSSSGSGGTCLAEGTMITLADGSKKAIEDLRKGDSVMAFDHLAGKVTNNDVIIVVKTQSDFYKNTFMFDDGTKLVTINEHGIYDIDLCKYVNIDHQNFNDYIGHNFVSIDVNGKIGTKKLVDVVSEWTTGYKYDIVTDQTLNYVAEDTLSVTHVLVDIINSFTFDENMLFDKAKMQADIKEYGLYSYDEWAEYCDISVFDQYNIPVMKVGVSKGLYTKEYIIDLINTYVLDESVQIVN